MKTETHFKLAKVLCEQCFPLATATEKFKFILGAVFPDAHPFSYLRGFFVKPFFGHNWENAKRYILSQAEKIPHHGIGFFKLGVLVHYICDAFTFTHNSQYTDGLLKHTEYEKRLHTVVMNSGSHENTSDLTVPDLKNHISDMHQNYENSDKGLDTDAMFIVKTVLSVLRSAKISNEKYGAPTYKPLGRRLPNLRGNKVT